MVKASPSRPSVALRRVGDIMDTAVAVEAMVRHIRECQHLQCVAGMSVKGPFSLTVYHQHSPLA